MTVDSVKRTKLTFGSVRVPFHPEGDGINYFCLKYDKDKEVLLLEYEAPENEPLNIRLVEGDPVLWEFPCKVCEAATIVFLFLHPERLPTQETQDEFLFSDVLQYTLLDHGNLRVERSEKKVVIPVYLKARPDDGINNLKELSIADIESKMSQFS